MSVFYLPVVVYILYLSGRYRRLSFLSVNPGLPMSGLIGERKADSLRQLQGVPELAQFAVLELRGDLTDQLGAVTQLMQAQGFDYPVVLKPDFGQRGQDVAVIRTPALMREYLTHAKGRLIVQEYVGGLEFGVFYMRFPAADAGRIYSITEKTFPVVIGDGERTLEHLLMANPRTHYMADFLLDLHADRLDWVLANGESFQVVEIGSHCRGSVFLNGNHHITPALTDVIDRVSRQIDGFNFGRYDVRVPDLDSLRNGRDVKVLEVNGVTSESTNIYDPDHSLVDAYRILLKQWRHAFEIGEQAIANGAEPVTFRQFVSHLKQTYFS
ncbi:carboxylate--amine ligase [Arenicella chitinivorans]|uniref:Carboxylate--amine ligase n=1 Tax=Arenicella chitinivorans TaxID=1329800 RepID=A0A918RKJ3_9GAMM|nr:hypothetical protein [Arenicella chitinivorans]GHA00097.1 carboxylate--amine ligase [Arenicella chitinivorans]